jgi:tellurite resistance protein TerC
VLYVLGVLLLVLAWRIYRGVGDEVDPDRNVVVRGVRRIFPVTEGFRGGHWFARENGTRHATPALLCLVAIGTADIAFAVDSIPAAFAITTDPLIIWMANVFALVGLRALFVLVEGLIRRFRYLDQTIACVLAIIAVKLLVEHWVKIGPVASLALVAIAFAIGIAASLLGDRRDPAGAEERRTSNGTPAPAGPSEP